jgi:rod shape determining protein RodA
MSFRVFVGTSYLFYAVTVLLLAVVLLFTEVRLGAQRWIAIGPFALQPSEFAKLATVLALSNYLGTHRPWEHEKKALCIALGLAALPLALIMKQPDLGSALLFVPMIVTLLFLWGIRYRYLIGTVLVGLLGMPVLWFALKEYQRKRILVFLDPNSDPLGAGYTALQSRIAIGSGGFFGKGFLHGTQSQLDFVPEHHTDFIFCVIGEEWGYLGVLVILSGYFFLFSAVFHVIQSTTDPQARLLAAGILAMFFAQAFINIGMSFGLMPITGITLPLISYGGSSFIATAAALGLILSIYRERSIF